MKWPELRHRRTLLAAAAVAIIALAVGAWRLIEGPSLGAYAVERRDLVQAIVATGRVESPRRVEIGAAITGTVAAVPVAEGQAVAAGTVLVRLDDAEARAAVEQARHALEQAQAKVGQLRATGLPVATEAERQADLNLANAERALVRSKELFNRGFVGQAALDEAQRARDVAASQLTAARLQRASQEAGGSDVQLALAALESARASLALAQARLELTTLEAPVAGVLISRNVEQGGVVQPGKVLMVLSPAGATQIVAQIDEKNLPLLRLGASALASADAYPDRRFNARVAYINPAVDASRGSVEVKLDVAEPPAYLLQDMTVSVDIEAAKLVGVLTLPADALGPGDYVLALKDGRTVRKAVKVGARGEGRIQIVAGLEEGERVLPASAVAVHEGEPVRARPAPAPGNRPP
jgi:HlyD family secretion protein